MDYEGKYFPDDDENQSKKAKVIKIVLRCVLYTAVAVVYIATIAVIFNSCEPKMYKQYCFSPEANAMYESNPEEFELYRIVPKKFMNYYGSVQLAGVAYSPTASELEIGIKYNKKLNNEETSFKPTFKLIDSNGTSYEICNTVSDESGRYCYLRLCYKGVELELNDNVYINSEASVTAEGEGDMYETFKYTLEIYTEGNEKPESLVIFDNATPVEVTKFE